MDFDTQLREILSNHESLCEDQDNACGDCRRLLAAIKQLIESKQPEKQAFKYDDTGFPIGTTNSDHYLMGFNAGIDAWREGMGLS